MTSTLIAAPDTALPMGFATLPISDITPVAADGSALLITLGVPHAHRAAFSFRPGQHVTVRATVAGQQVRRSYSLCSTPADLTERGRLSIGVRLVPDGLFSTHARSLAPGHGLDIMPPKGTFTTAVDASRSQRYAALAAGSGITPVLSLAATVLATESDSTVTLVYANRTLASAMFIDELADLKDRYLHRFEVCHLTLRQDRREGLPAGRPDEETLRQLLPQLFDTAAIDEWFVCGPADVCRSATHVLRSFGIAANDIRQELFTPAGGQPAPRRAVTTPTDGVLDTIAYGRRTTAPLLPGATVLDSALASNPDLPYSCKTGVCGTCRARLTTGEVEVGPQWALTDEESAAGHILTCQATPRSDTLTIDFDSI